MFFANQWASDGRLDLSFMPPGRYRARLLTDDTEAGSWGVVGRPHGAAVEFTVDAAGKPQPPHIF